MHASRTFAVLLSLTAPLAFPLAGCGTPAPVNDGDPTDVLALHDEGLLGNGVTRTEVQTVLKVVDDVCGDTWCEGDNDFRFRYLFCETDAATCTLLFQMGARQEAPSPPDWHWRSCRTSGFLGFDSLVSTANGGYQWLTSTYYEALSACIDELEKANAGP